MTQKEEEQGNLFYDDFSDDVQHDDMCEGDEQADGAGLFQSAEYAKCTYCLAVLNHQGHPSVHIKTLRLAANYSSSILS